MAMLLLSVPTVICALLLWEASWIVYCRYFHPLRSIPGPFWASVSRLWITYHTATGAAEHMERALHKKYGNDDLIQINCFETDISGYLVRIAPNEVSCSDPEAIRIIYGAKRVFTKTDFYNVWEAPNTGYPGHFPARNEKVHSERRRIVNNIYSMSSVLESEEAIDSCTEQFCQILHDFAKSKSVLDLSFWTNLYAFDVIGELFYAEKFGFMSQRKDLNNIMGAVESLLPAFTISATMPSYLSKATFLLMILFSSSACGALGAMKLIDAASNKAIEKRKQEVSQNKDDKRDMLRKMLEIVREKGEKVEFSDTHVGVESFTALFAGADTTSIAMNSILYHLMRNPAAYKKLTAEIDDAVKNRTLQMPAAYAQAIKLPYLKACVNEGMRLHPSVGLVMPRHVPDGGATIAGFDFPAGYRVGINAAVVQYDTHVFGPDADDFNPDRWITGDATLMERGMLSFGGGPRTCIGKNISLSEIYKLIPQLLWSFNIRLADPDKEWQTRNYWFNKQSNINIYVEERTNF